MTSDGTHMGTHVHRHPTPPQNNKTRNNPPTPIFTTPLWWPGYCLLLGNPTADVGGLSSWVDQSPRHSQLTVFAPPTGFGRTKDLSGWCSHGTHSNCGMLPVLQQDVSEASVAATGDTVWEVVRTENHCEAPHPGTLQERGSQRGWRTPGDKAH